MYTAVTPSGRMGGSVSCIDSTPSVFGTVVVVVVVYVVVGVVVYVVELVIVDVVDGVEVVDEVGFVVVLVPVLELVVLGGCGPNPPIDNVAIMIIATTNVVTPVIMTFLFVLMSFSWKWRQYNRAFLNDILETRKMLFNFLNDKKVINVQDDKWFHERKGD